MSHSIVRASVRDYTAWLAGFDALASARKAFGATGNDQIYRDEEDPNTITVITEWENEKGARQWFASSTLKQALAHDAAIVIVEPHIIKRA